MIEIYWTSENQVIPNYGVAENGKTISLPLSMAQDFVARGFAKFTEED